MWRLDVKRDYARPTPLAEVLTILIAAVPFALLGCASSETQSDVPVSPYAAEGLLMSDGELLPAGQMSPYLRDAAAALQSLIAGHAKTHTPEVAEDAVGVVLSANRPVKSTTEAEVFFLPDWRRPESWFTRAGAHARALRGAAVYHVHKADGTWERRFVRFEPTPGEWAIDRDLVVLSVGPHARWVGWDGHQLVLGTIGDHELNVESRLTLPAGARMRDYYEQVCWLRGGETVLVLGSTRIDQEDGAFTTRAHAVSVDWNTKTMTPAERFVPDAALSDELVLGYRRGPDVDSLTEGYWIATIDDQEHLKWVNKAGGFRFQDVLVCVSPTGKRALVREVSNIMRLPSAPPPYRFRSVRSKDGGQEMPRWQPDYRRNPLGWLDLRPLLEGRVGTRHYPPETQHALAAVAVESTHFAQLPQDQPVLFVERRETNRVVIYVTADAAERREFLLMCARGDQGQWQQKQEAAEPADAARVVGDIVTQLHARPQATVFYPVQDDLREALLLLQAKGDREVRIEVLPK